MSTRPFDLPIGAALLDWHETGSAYICPEIGPRDHDYILLCDQMPQATEIIDSEQSGDGLFVNVKQDGIDLIMTMDHEFYKRFVAATECAKRLHLIQKPDRIALFQAVLYGNVWAEA